jgi:hypothetical protein
MCLPDDFPKEEDHHVSAGDRANDCAGIYIAPWQKAYAATVI